MSRLMSKPTKWHVRPAKTHISLGIRPVWSESSLCAQRVAKEPSFLHVDSKDSDQTGRMPKLIWVFAGRAVILLVLSWGGSNDPAEAGYLLLVTGYWFIYWLLIRFTVTDSFTGYWFVYWLLIHLLVTDSFTGYWFVYWLLIHLLITDSFTGYWFDILVTDSV